MVSTPRIPCWEWISSGGKGLTEFDRRYIGRGRGRGRDNCNDNSDEHGQGLRLGRGRGISNGSDEENEKVSFNVLNFNGYGQYTESQTKEWMMDDSDGKTLSKLKKPADKLRRGRQEHWNSRIPIEIVRALCKWQETRGCEGESLIESKDVNIICDKMLQGLGRLLRTCGLSVINMEENSNSDLLSARRRYNFIVTRGKRRYNDFLLEFSMKQVLFINSDVILEQIIEIFDYFKIAVAKVDCHTICWNCNSNIFIEPSKKLIQQLLERRGFKKSESLMHNEFQTLKLNIPQEMITCIEQDNQRNWQILPEKVIVIRSVAQTERQTPIAFISKGVPIDLNKIPCHLSEFIDGYYICNSCAKCYWSSKILEKLLYPPES